MGGADGKGRVFGRVGGLDFAGAGDSDSLPAMPNVTEIIGKAVETALEGKTSSRVIVTPMSDSYGDEALGVTIVLGDANLSGSEGLRMLVAIHDALTGAGDDRFPILDVTTDSELALDDGPES